MRDQIELVVNNRSLEMIESCEIDSDLYRPADSFSIRLADLTVNIAGGQPCHIFVNKQLVMKGIVDSVTEGYGKAGRHFRVEGRDLMGEAIDYYLTEFQTFRGKKLIDLVRSMLTKLDHLKRSPVVIEPKTAQSDVTEEFIQTIPGQTVFDVIAGAARARGLLFYCRPDGTVVIGKPQGRGGAAFSLEYRNGKNRSEILNGDRVQDMSERYSEIHVLVQRQDSGALGAANISTSAIVKDPGVPYKKPFVKIVEESADPDERAAALRNEFQFRGDQYVYVVRGFSQGTRPWATDRVCTVHDDMLRVRGSYLIYGRRFSLSKQAGATTELKLASAGAVL